MSATAMPPQAEAAAKSEGRHGNMPLNMITCYSFFQINSAFRQLSKLERDAAIHEAVDVIRRYDDRMWIRAYSTFGLREDADFFFWHVAKEVEHIHDFATDLYRTALGPYLNQTHNYMAVSKESDYTRDHEHPPRPQVDDPKYLFVYPFVKTREWYLLPFEQRMKMIKEHIDVGHEFPEVTINTAYSFGIDDQDFVVAFDGNSLQEFVRLVMRLRETKASRYTERDNPMFIGIKKPFADVFWSLGV